MCTCFSLFVCQCLSLCLSNLSVSFPFQFVSGLSFLSRHPSFMSLFYCFSFTSLFSLSLSLSLFLSLVRVCVLLLSPAEHPTLVCVKPQAQCHFHSRRIVNALCCVLCGCVAVGDSTPLTTAPRDHVTTAARGDRWTQAPSDQIKSLNNARFTMQAPWGIVSLVQGNGWTYVCLNAAPIDVRKACGRAQHSLSRVCRDAVPIDLNVQGYSTMD